MSFWSFLVVVVAGCFGLDQVYCLPYAIAIDYFLGSRRRVDMAKASTANLVHRFDTPLQSVWPKIAMWRE